jgi:hypothetical protein
MSGVNLSGIADWPHTLNIIPSLSAMRLPFCSLERASQSIPDFNLTSLEMLDLSENHFDHSITSGIVDGFGRQQASSTSIFMLMISLDHFMMHWKI